MAGDVLCVTRSAISKRGRKDKMAQCSTSREIRSRFVVLGMSTTVTRHNIASEFSGGGGQSDRLYYYLCFRGDARLTAGEHASLSFGVYYYHTLDG